MRKWLLFSVGLLILAPVYSQAEQDKIYKSIDADGRVTYSDVLSNQAQAVTPGQPSTYQAARQVIGLIPAIDIDSKRHAYQIIEITSPLTDQGIRSNAGNLNIKVRLVPALSAGHKITLFIDGKATATAPTKQSGMWIFANANLDRGRHQFQAKILSTSNQDIIIASAPVAVTILRHSILHQRQLKPKQKQT